MAKNKKTEIAHYEVLYIISNKYSENELKPIHKLVVKIIEDNEGKIVFTEDWGKKKLSYPIKHFNYGYYTLLEFDAFGKNLEKINKTLRISKEILRFQIVTKIPRVETEIKKDKAKIKAKEMAVKAKEDEKKKIELEKEKTRGKVDLKELDEKLDKILETDDLL